MDTPVIFKGSRLSITSTATKEDFANVFLNHVSDQKMAIDCIATIGFVHFGTLSITIHRLSWDDYDRKKISFTGCGKIENQKVFSLEGYFHFGQREGQIWVMHIF